MTEIKLALIGNPNIGKSSLFNQLTGLRQKVGNYPGVTIDKKTGTFTHHQVLYKLYDLPGTYSLYPNSQDEEVAHEILLDPQHPDHPDGVIVVADSLNLKRSLAIFEQVSDMGIPLILVLNMEDEALKKGIHIHVQQLEQTYQVPVISTNARKGTGINNLLEKIGQGFKKGPAPLFKVPAGFQAAVESVCRQLSIPGEYAAWHVLAQKKSDFLSDEQKNRLQEIRTQHSIIPKRLQVTELLARSNRIDELLSKAQSFSPLNNKSITAQIDRWAMHPFWGYIIFGAILFIVFQAIFTLSQFPMQWIEMFFLFISDLIKGWMPDGPLQGLIADAIVPGIGGILIFVPQIAILFFLLLLLEETGYMSRVVFLMDRWMKPFGLNGKSIVPLISGAACAIPAVMSARNIENRKEKLITILVTPFMTCSARLPVYSLIIGLIITDQGNSLFNLKGLFLLALYALGVLGALCTGLVLRWVVKDTYKSYLAIEIPAYHYPAWKNVFISLWEKVSAFVFGAGKIILAISIILWGLASFGPGFKEYEPVLTPADLSLTAEEQEVKKKSYQLEHSYLGLVGNWFEPAIRPLGYDWKTGIAILSSFAAREVFVPTMATIYSIADADNKKLLHEKMQSAVNQRTGKPVYTVATGVSLLLFYAFAMMCMSTFAAVKRETKTWKWPLIQLILMSGLAYIAALLAYQFLK
jgi:ferrous iron transport protein B